MNAIVIKSLPYIAGAAIAAVFAPDAAFAAGGGNPVVSFLNTCVTQGTLGGFGITALGVMGVGGSIATGNHQIVMPAAKVGGGGATIAGASQLVGLFLPNAGGASIDLASAAMTAIDWLHLIAAAF